MYTFDHEEAMKAIDHPTVRENNMTVDVNEMTNSAIWGMMRLTGREILHKLVYSSEPLTTANIDGSIEEVSKFPGVVECIMLDGDARGWAATYKGGQILAVGQYSEPEKWFKRYKGYTKGDTFSTEDGNIHTVKHFKYYNGGVGIVTCKGRHVDFYSVSWFTEENEE